VGEGFVVEFGLLEDRFELLEGTGVTVVVEFVGVVPLGVAVVIVWQKLPLVPFSPTTSLLLLMFSEVVAFGEACFIFDDEQEGESPVGGLALLLLEVAVGIGVDESVCCFFPALGGAVLCCFPFLDFFPLFALPLALLLFGLLLLLLFTILLLLLPLLTELCDALELLLLTLLLFALLAVDVLDPLTETLLLLPLDSNDFRAFSLNSILFLRFGETALEGTFFPPLLLLADCEADDEENCELLLLLLETELLLRIAGSKATPSLISIVLMIASDPALRLCK
jgi:hypothetical protein